MEFLVERLLMMVALLAATLIVFRGWRRYPHRASKLAMLGFALVLLSSTLSLLAYLAIRSMDVSALTYGIVLSVLGIPGFVGTILIVCGFWVAGRLQRPADLNREGG